MYICPNCNAKTEEAVNFCSKCGTQMVYAEPQPIEPQPVAPQYQPAQAYQPVPAPVKKPHIAVKIVSMALSIEGFICAILGALYTLIGLIEPAVAFLFSLIFGMVSLPFSIIGLCLGSKCTNAGDTSVFSRLGKIFGLIGIIVAGVSLFIGLISLGAY